MIFRVAIKLLKTLSKFSIGATILSSAICGLYWLGMWSFTLGRGQPLGELREHWLRFIVAPVFGFAAFVFVFGIVVMGYHLVRVLWKGLRGLIEFCYAIGDSLIVGVGRKIGSKK